MNLFLIDETKRKKFALWGIIVNLMFLHVWASVLVASALYANTDTETVRLMFSSIMSAIGISLLVLISDKAVDFVIAKFAPGTAPAATSVTETVTRTVTPALPVADTPVANDVSMKVEGDVNISNTPA